MQEKPFFTLSETAVILGCSLTTIRRWSANGRLPTIHFSKRTVRVSRTVIESLIEYGLSEELLKEVKNA
jgi:excisionase family DNA binding protein